jgi:hypothetical protein
MGTFLMSSQQMKILSPLMGSHTLSMVPLSWEPTQYFQSGRKKIREQTLIMVHTVETRTTTPLSSFIQRVLQHQQPTMKELQIREPSTMQMNGLHGTQHQSNNPLHSQLKQSSFRKSPNIRSSHRI